MKNELLFYNKMIKEYNIYVSDCLDKGIDYFYNISYWLIRKL